MQLSILPVLTVLLAATQVQVQAVALPDPVAEVSPYKASLDWLFKRGGTPYCCIFANHIECCE